MAVFNYTAIKDGKEIVKGKIEAVNVKEARYLITQLGLVPTKVVDPTAKPQDYHIKEEQAEARKKAKLSKLSLREKIDFTYTLQILLKAGVPLIEALVFLEKDSNSPNVVLISQELRKQIIAGTNFADSISKYPQIFDFLYIGLVRAGEESGELDVTMNRICSLLEKQDAIRNKVIGTLMYPVLVIVLAIVIVVVMLMFVFPAFKTMYEGMGATLPWITQFCIDAGMFLQNFWFVIPMIVGALIFLCRIVFSLESVKNFIDDQILKIPLINQFVQLSSFSNFISVMNVAYEAGVPIVDCLYLSNMTINNYTLSTAIKKAAVKVQQGLHLSTALKASGVVPSIILFMVSTGEQSGKLGEMLGKAGDYIDIQLDRVIGALTKFIEPIMLIVIGAIVLVLALALYLPLFQSYANIGQ